MNKVGPSPGYGRIKPPRGYLSWAGLVVRLKVSMKTKGGVGFDEGEELICYRVFRGLWLLEIGEGRVGSWRRVHYVDPASVEVVRSCIANELERAGIQ